MNIIRSVHSNIGDKHSLGNPISGGIISNVVFLDPLTDDELSYLKLTARIDFNQLVFTAISMNEGLTFKEATIKYLKN